MAGACETLGPAPTWVLFEEPGAGPRWFVLPAALGPDAVLDPEHVLGAHVDPVEVLAWLRGASAGVGIEPSSGPDVEVVRRAAQLLRVPAGVQSEDA